jgi:hypothetical protein
MIITHGNGRLHQQFVAQARCLPAGVHPADSVIVLGRLDGRQRFELLVGAAVFVNNLLIIAPLMK